MTGKQIAAKLGQERHFLQNVIKDFKSEHGDFRPTPEMMTVAQQINHVAHTLNWFCEGAFGAGFDMDFEKMNAEVKREISLENALARLNAAYAEAARVVENKTENELNSPLSPNPILGEVPRAEIFAANAEHTAHHRGILTVYLRLLGITPTMVYS